jgi:hypothetical protein
MIVLLSTAPVKPAGNATEGDPVGIYPHGRVPLHPSQQAGRGPGFARLRAWHSAKVEPGTTCFEFASKKAVNRITKFRR